MAMCDSLIAAGTVEGTVMLFLDGLPLRDVQTRVNVSAISLSHLSSGLYVLAVGSGEDGLLQIFGAFDPRNLCSREEDAVPLVFSAVTLGAKVSTITIT